MITRNPHYDAQVHMDRMEAAGAAQEADEIIAYQSLTRMLAAGNAEDFLADLAGFKNFDERIAKAFMKLVHSKSTEAMAQAQVEAENLLHDMKLAWIEHFGG